MLDSKIHRVWIQNARDKPVGLVSMTDVLHICLNSE